MPSDVESSTLAQQWVTKHASPSPPPSAITVFRKRYQALREAGFDELTANKYSSLYSSVNEVIDAILSQSLADRPFEANSNLNGLHANEDVSIHSNTVSQDQPHLEEMRARMHCEQRAGEKPEEQCARVDSGPECSEPSGGEAMGTHVQHRHSQQAQHFNNLFDVHFSPVGVESNGAANGARVSGAVSPAVPQGNCVGTAPHPMVSLSEQFIASRAPSSQQPLQHPHSSHNYGHSRNYLNGCQVDLNNTGNGAGSSSFTHSTRLIATMLKEGLLGESTDEMNLLEDEGLLPEQTASPSSSQSSGVSCFFADTASSSPSSFSSLSSSISTTPPNVQSNSYESNGTDHLTSSMVDLYLGSKSSLTNGKASHLKQKTSQNFTSAYPHNEIESTDLNCETLTNFTLLPSRSDQSLFLNTSSDGFTTQTQHQFNTTKMNKAFEYNNNESPTNIEQDLHRNGRAYRDDSKSSLAFGDMVTKFGNLSTEGELSTIDNHFGAELSHLLPDSHQQNDYIKYLSQSKLSNLDSMTRDNPKNMSKNFSNIASEECSFNDLFGYLNMGNQSQQQVRQHQALFDFDQNGTNESSFGFGGVEALNHKNDPFPELNFGMKSNTSLFGENESMFNLSVESDFMSSQSYQSAFMSQPGRSFADIAATSLVANGASGDAFMSFVECKSPKPTNSLGMTNGYGLNLFTNGHSSYYPEANGDQNCAVTKRQQQSPLGKYNCYKQQASPVSPMSDKFSNGQFQTGEHFAASSMRSIDRMMVNGGVTRSESPGCGSGESSSPNRPTNLMGYKGLWVCNVSPEATLAYLKRRFRRYGHFTGIQTFERRATNGSNIVFVHYDNPYSPVEAIAALHNYNGPDLCADQNEPLKLRFAPSMEQSRTGQLPTLEQARKIVEKSGECFNWRLSSGCHRAHRCQLKHIPINKEIDSQPWVKALKKKNMDN